ncbi:alkaline phosphatase [Companilactobacillus ginsenosidimutans]|uniref:Alkaline phosphatase n=2 Tax=Companilactobacillus ginsenosidimutans TaxID=1007676 RepID=A0A0H4QJ71_9LACO|nr:alkaline phosphatase [Companilactobacillus ginsenosidimutans]
MLNTRLGFMFFLVFILWTKSVFAYYADFSLGLADPLQHFIAIINPIGFTIVLLSLTLYINRPKLSYTLMIILYFISTLLVYSNVLYFREFSNFISITTITGVFSVSKGLGGSAVQSMLPHDFLYWIDFVILLVLFITKFITLDSRPFRKLNAFATTSFGLMFFSLNLMLADCNRPQLISRTFDQTYTVKYLGLPAFTTLDAINTVQSNQVRSTATGTDIDPDLNYIQNHYASPDPEYFGKANRKNIIIIHLESFQQFLINLKINDQEVTPFLNSLYADNNTISFDNFFNQVGFGKTSDAETMLETGLFGTPTGSFFTHQEKTNTSQGAPAILKQKKGYTGAVFHGNVMSFYDRDTVYKNLGYDYFFDQSYFNKLDAPPMEFGLQDKLMLSQSAKYLEQLQQPFYTKFITVTNHYPFKLPDMDKEDFSGQGVTPSETVNDYFESAHYLDSSLKEFFDYLKTSGLYKNSMIVLYGDHYGISERRAAPLSQFIGHNPPEWNDFDNAQSQRVPFMIHMNGLKGGVKHEYGGEIDVLPTILHLAGVNTQNYTHVGTDLLSKNHKQIVAFRNGNFVTPQYTVLKNPFTVFDNKTGESIDLKQNPILMKKIINWTKQVNQQLQVSDDINNLNLLRFYTPAGFTPVDPSKYSYLNQVQQMIKIRDNLGSASTSMYSKNDDTSTTSLYNTDAPEVKDSGRDSIDNLYSVLPKK